MRRSALRVLGEPELRQRSAKPRSRSPRRVRAPAVGGAAAALLDLAAPAAVQGVIATGSGRDGAIVALVLGLVGMCLAGLHLATSSGGIGTGNGRAGAVVALALGLIGVVLGRLALVRSSRTG